MRNNYVQAACIGLLTMYTALAATDTPPVLEYGQVPSLPLPKTLAFSIGPDQILEDAGQWKSIGVDGFFMGGVADNWASDVWAVDGMRHTIGASDETFQKVCRVTELCSSLDMDVFLKTVYAHPLEWFNDTAWQHIYHNFRQFAIFARDSGCKGIALDIEYIGEQYSFDWPGYDYEDYTRKDLIRTIRERSTGILQAMYGEFPDMVFLILPEESFTLGTHIETAWVEEAARVNAPGGIHLCMESTYITADIRRSFAYASAANQLFGKLLSPAGLAYWREHCSLASGVWPVGYDVLGRSSADELPGQLRQGWAASLMASPKYNWIYLDRFEEQHLGRDLDKYSGTVNFSTCNRILAEKQLATDERYVSIAQDLRSLSDKDFAHDLGLSAVPKFMFPYTVPVLELSAADRVTPEETDREWRIALDYYHGTEQDLQSLYGPVLDWQIIGPFRSHEWLKGHDTAFPPESEIQLDSEYDGVDGKISWQSYRVGENGLGIDFKTLFVPTEQVTAYALCWVESPVEQAVQARFSSNDAGKLWIDGRLVDDFGRESWSILDRDIIPIMLRKGKTPVLAKVTNGIGSWSLVLRFTDELGMPIDGITYSTMP